MNKTLLNHFLKQISRYRFFILLFFSVNSWAETSNLNSNSDYDSLRVVIQNIETDTSKFKVLNSFFWKYYNSDFNRAKPVGEWAYNEIKNSKNLKLLSDGYDIKGVILEREQKYDSAYTLFQKVLVISKSINYNTRTSWTYYHLALNNRNLGQTDSAIYYYKILIDFITNVNYGIDARAALKELSWYFNELELPDSTLHYLNKALELSRQINDIEQEIVSLLEIASFYNSHNDIRNEINCLDKALALAPKSNNPKAIIDVYYRIGNLFYKQKKNYDIALNYYNKVLELSRGVSESFEANVLLDIARLYEETDNDSLAMRYTLQSLDVSKRLKFQHMISEAHKTLGTIYMQQGKLVEAIDNLNYCYNMGCDKCPKIKFHSSLIQIAKAYQLQNNPEKELEYYTKSLQLALEFNTKTEKAISGLELGNFYRKTNSALTERYYSEALDNANGSNDIMVHKTIADTLSSFYYHKANYKQAYEYNLLARHLGDSLQQIENQASMAEWELRFEFEKLKNENESKEKLSGLEINKQKAYRNSAVLVSLLLLVLGWVIWRSYKIKKRDLFILEEQKKEIEDKNLEILAQVEEITVQKDEIERISGELHEADEMKLRFFANVSHELRTPLTLILNPAKNLLETSPYNGEHKKQLEYIYSNALKLHDLTNQIMDMQKLDAGKLQLNIEQDDIIHYCVGLISSFESLCEPKNVTIQVESNVSQVIAGFDKDKIGKILTNLLSNAIKFCFANSAVLIKIMVTDNRFSLRIEDKGAGIPANEVNDVFRRYKQASNNRNTGGTGLGLAYVHELATFMNGVVSLESEENIGTTVTAEIPVTVLEIKEHTVLNIEIANKQKLQTTRSFDSREFTDENSDRALILIVEDNDQLRDYIAKLFQPEYNIILATDGQAGIELAIKHTPDIIISDVMMPIMNGFELCIAIKTNEHTSHIPVVLLTAKDTGQSIREGYETGADDYILKPFDNELLKLKVRNVIATRDAARRQFDFQSILTVDNLKLGNTDKEFMKKCFAVVEKNIDNSAFGVDQLAEALAFSSRNFYRKIQSLTNQTPAELIRVYRLHYAKQLLQNTKMRVSEIAGAVGYDDVKRFSQAFKKQFDKLPSELTGNAVS